MSDKKYAIKVIVGCEHVPPCLTEEIHSLKDEISRLREEQIKYIQDWKTASKEAEANMLRAEQAEAQLAGVVGILEESKFLLWHTKCRDDDATKCPACSLESRIERLIANLPESAKWIMDVVNAAKEQATALEELCSDLKSKGIIGEPENGLSGPKNKLLAAVRALKEQSP